MDFLFNCSECGQELEVDSSAAGSAIDCPTCGKNIVIPSGNGQPALVAPVMLSAEAKVERHFSVPQHGGKTKADLIQKPAPPLEIAAKETDKKIRIKTIK